MIDLRLMPRSAIRDLAVGDEFMDQDGYVYVVTSKTDDTITAAKK